jgi:hypothetical protein
MNDNTKKLTVENIISVENLLLAWREFVCGKKDRKDVMEFSLCLSENIFDLHYSLKSKTYTHGGYHAFKISDPKPRDIHKASVRDRLSHHAIYRVLCPHFDRKFIFDSYSCRDGKGTHKAIDRLNLFARKVSKNNTKQCWILKCDIKKFFASVDQKTLIEILDRQIEDKNIVWLVRKVVESFLVNTCKEFFNDAFQNPALFSVIFRNFSSEKIQTVDCLVCSLSVSARIRVKNKFPVKMRTQNSVNSVVRQPIAHRCLMNIARLWIGDFKSVIATMSIGLTFQTIMQIKNIFRQT